MALLAYDTADWTTLDADIRGDDARASVIAYAHAANALRGLGDGQDSCPDAAIDHATWRRIDDHLAALYLEGRHALRVVAVGCGNGEWLLRTIARARAIGFTAIEGHGSDTSAASIGDARRRAAVMVDPAIGLSFAVADLHGTLAREMDNPADLILCLDTTLNRLPPALRDATASALAMAGAVLIARARAATDGGSATLIDQGCAMARDATRDRLEIDLPDGVHISLPWHGFTADELAALFAPLGRVSVEGGRRRADGTTGDLLIELVSGRGA